MDLDVGCSEFAHDAFAVSQEPAVIVCAALAFRRGSTWECVVLVKSAQDDDLFACHEHQVLWLCGWIVDEGSAGADASLLEGKSGPSVECMSFHVAMLLEASSVIRSEKRDYEGREDEETGCSVKTVNVCWPMMEYATNVVGASGKSVGESWMAGLK